MSEGFNNILAGPGQPGYDPARLAVFAFSTPLFGVAIAAFFREGAPSPWLIVAGLAVAVGISLVNWKESSGTS